MRRLFPFLGKLFLYFLVLGLELRDFLGPFLLVFGCSDLVFLHLLAKLHLHVFAHLVELFCGFLLLLLHLFERFLANRIPDLREDLRLEVLDAG